MKHLSPLLRASLGVTLVLINLCAVASFVAAQICVQPPEGLVSWWPGEGDANDIVGNNHGTLQNGATFAAGMVGEAFSFDGIDDYIQVPHHPSLNLSSALTVEAWINATSTEGPRVIAAKWNDNTEDWSYIFKDHNFSDKLHIGLSESFHNDLVDLEGSTSIPLGTWVHVAATYDASEGIARLYFNGVEDASQAVGSGRLIVASLTDLLIGALFTGGDILENFGGLIDEVSIYNRALTPSEIQAIFTAGSTGKCKGVPFTPMAAQTTLSIGSQAADDTFDLQATFILGDGSNGINPLTEVVILQVGTSALTIPAGSFHRTSAGALQFAGVLEGVTLQVTITPLTRAAFEVVARGEGATLSGIAVPVPLGLTIGDDNGNTTLPIAAVSARTPPPQR